MTVSVQRPASQGWTPRLPSWQSLSAIAIMALIAIYILGDVFARPASAPAIETVLHLDGKEVPGYLLGPQIPEKIFTRSTLSGSARKGNSIAMFTIHCDGGSTKLTGSVSWAPPGTFAAKSSGDEKGSKEPCTPAEIARLFLQLNPLKDFGDKVVDFAARQELWLAASSALLKAIGIRSPGQ